jgi:hypothetical protein
MADEPARAAVNTVCRSEWRFEQHRLLGQRRAQGRAAHQQALLT